MFYVEQLSSAENFNVWLVDGSYIRKKMGIEFTNFGQPLHFSFMPDDEFWIDVNTNPSEHEGFIQHMLKEYELMSGGMSYEEAYDIASKKEKIVRVKQWVKFGITRIAPSKDVRIEAFCVVGRVTVYIVDSKLVRDTIDQDFVQGGHDLVYDYIPVNEIWLDCDLSEEEMPYVFAHEYLERTLMETDKDLTYKAAHNQASEFELSLRNWSK
jgi:hypothetical protein